MADYDRDVVYRSDLTGEFFYAPKVRHLGGNVRCVVGRKVNITRQLQPFLLAKFRRTARKEPDRG